MEENEEKKRGVFTLSERETTHVIVGLLLGGFLLFVSGYYLGKRSACEYFVFGDDVQFARKVRTALGSLAGRPGEQEGQEGDEDDAAEAVETAQESGSSDGATVKNNTQAFAHLCGFGSHASAQAYVDRLAKRHVGAHVVERTSTSTQGHRVVWYQVVTDAMDRQELITLVADIKRCDKLTDVSIVDLVE